MSSGLGRGALEWEGNPQPSSWDGVELGTGARTASCAVAMHLVTPTVECLLEGALCNVAQEITETSRGH